MTMENQTLSRRQLLASMGMAGVLLLTDSIKQPQVAEAAESTDFVFNVMNYGAKGDGSQDDAAAIQSAINAASAHGGGTVYLPSGTYLLAQMTGSNNALLVPKSNVTLCGDGDASVLLVADGLNAIASYGFNVIYPPESTPDYNVSNAVFRNFKVDCNGAKNLVPSGSTGKKNAAIGIRYGQQIVVENVTVENNAGQQCFSFGSNQKPHTIQNLRIANCRVNNVGRAVPGNGNQTDHSVIYAQADGCVLAENLLTNSAPGFGTAIECHASNAVIVNNVIVNYDTGVNVVATYTDQVNSLYANNTMKQVGRGFWFWTKPNQIMARILVQGNVIEQALGVYPVLDLSTTVESPIEDVLIAENKMINSFAGTSTNYGAGVLVGQVKSCVIQNNQLHRLLGRAISLGTILDGETSLTIQNNELLDCGRTANSTISHRYAIGLYSANKLARLLIRHNQIVNTSTSQPAMVQGIGGNAGILHGVFQGNTMTNVAQEMGWDSTNSGTPVQLDSLQVDHVGSGSPEGVVRASVGSRWVDRKTGDLWLKKMYLASGTGWRVERQDTAAPKTGSWKVADKVYNTAPTAGGYEGWICVADGTPGVWKGFGLIQS